MSKTNVEEAVKRAKEQVRNTSGGRQLRGTYYGQEKDAKTISTTEKRRPRSGGSDKKS